MPNKRTLQEASAHARGAADQNEARRAEVVTKEAAGHMSVVGGVFYDIVSCPRCCGSHPETIMFPLTHKCLNATHWATCPVLDEPIIAIVPEV
jgi:hypothetical protein